MALKQWLVVLFSLRSWWCVNISTKKQFSSSSLLWSASESLRVLSISVSKIVFINGIFPLVVNSVFVLCRRMSTRGRGSATTRTNAVAQGVEQGDAHQDQDCSDECHEYDEPSCAVGVFERFDLQHVVQSKADNRLHKFCVERIRHISVYSSLTGMHDWLNRS